MKRGVERWFALVAIRIASLIMPGSLRVKWRREWAGEIWARSDEGRPVIWHALGAYRHSVWVSGDALVSLLRRSRGDVRYAIRTLRRRPLFTLTVVATLALGIGATTAVFSVVDKVLLAPLPYPGGERLVQVTATYTPRDIKQGGRTTTLEALEAYTVADRNLIGSGTPAVVQEGSVTSGFLSDLLDVSPLLGRTFTTRENEPGLGSVAILAESLWRERFGASVDVIGRTIRIDDQPREIIGVLPEVAILPLVDVWTPADLSLDWARTRTRFGSLTTLARARAGVDLEAVRQDLATVSEGAGSEFGSTVEPWRAEVFDYRSLLVGDVEANLWILMGAVVAVLLIACVNIANLLLARGVERTPELVLRSSLGASIGDLARQVFLEGAVLAGVGGLVGMGLAWVGLDVLMAWVPAEIPLGSTTGMDSRVLLFGFSVTVFTGVLFSVLPALRTGKLSIGRIRAQNASIGRHEKMRGAVLLGLEVAQATALLVAAILMVTTLLHKKDADSGFNPDGIIFVHLNMPTYDYGRGGFTDSALRDRFVEELKPRIVALPGVESVGVGTATPFTGMTFMTALQQEGGPRVGSSNGGLGVASEGDLIWFAQLWVDAQYLATLGLPIVSGRPFRDSDRGGSPVVLINETAAAAFWPGESALGWRVRSGADGSWTTIVGVVRDFEHPGIPTAGQAEIYSPLDATPQLVTLLVRFDGEADVIRQQIQRAIWAIDPDLPIPAVRTAREVLAASLGMTEFYTLLLGLFAGLAILLTSVGIYGVMAYSVARRTREMGIRIALGADQTRLTAVVLREAMGVVGTGLIIGLLMARVGSRIMESLLFEVEPTDPFTYGIVALVVSVTSVAAVWFPARRATKANLLDVLRAD